MRLGIAISENLSVSQQQAIARRVEDVGLDSLWTNEGNRRDAFLLCHAWAAVTSRIDVGIGVATLWTRTAPQFAMSSATLQEVSGGRFLLGLGVSHPAKMSEGHGIEVRKPVTATREMLAILSQIDQGGPTDVEGELFRSTGFTLDIEPPPPPTRRYIAAMGPRMLEVAGGFADGVLLNWASPLEIPSARARVHDAARAAGRSAEEVEIAAYVRILLGRDRQAARNALAMQVLRYLRRPAYTAHFERQGFSGAIGRAREAQRNSLGPDAVAEALGDDLLSQLGWSGTPEDDLTQVLDSYRDAGVDHLIARVAVVDDPPIDTIHHVMDAIAATRTRRPT